MSGDGRLISINIASAAGHEGVAELVTKALAYYDTGVLNEHGKFVMGTDVPGNGCAMVYIWPPEELS